VYLKAVTVSVSPLPEGTTAKARDFSLDWDRSVDSEGVTTLPGLAPGAYSLEKGSPDGAENCILDTDTPSAWVLIVPEDKFTQIDKAWKESAVQLKELEVAGASARILATFRHTVISYLADSLSE